MILQLKINGFNHFSGAMLESIQVADYARLRVGLLYFSSVLFSVLATSFTINQELEGAVAGVYGLIGGYLCMY